MSTPLTISSVGYTIPLLHAAKNLSNAVIGVFLAPAGPSSSTTSVNVTDAIPLIHNYTPLTPITEAGLESVQEYARSKSLRVIGLYVGHAGDETGLGRIGERLFGVLKVSSEDFFALVIDNSRLGTLEIPYIVYTSPKTPSQAGSLPSGWKLETEDVKAIALRLIREDRAFRDIVDFDDHLEDPEADWLGNEKVKAVIRKRL